MHTLIRSKRTLFVMTLALFGIVFTGCSLGGASVSLEPLEPGYVLFHDDFSDDAVGEVPGKWTLQEGNETDVNVVEVEGEEFDRAVHVFADKNTDTYIRAYFNNPALARAEVIKVEFFTKHSPDNYTTNLAPFRIARFNYTGIFLPTGKNVVIGGAKRAELDPDSWNKFEVIIDLPENTYEVTVNGENLGTFDFRGDTQLTSWHNTDEFYFDVETKGNAEKASEAYYADLKVTVVE